ncbi:MAG: 2Fe-2S iron-sulfur cluster-binding protein [Actinomycetota bacterium]
MSVIKLNSGKTFQAPTGLSILDAAAQAHIALPYSCKTGRCSTCKCKVISGTTAALQSETGLTEQERTEGWILSCVRSAETDVVLEVDELGGVELPIAKTLPCRISQINRLAPDVIQVFLRLPPTAEFSFIPGQYIDVIGPNGIRRSYSLANANLADKVLELHIRAVEGGAMSQYWFNQAKTNDLLRLNGPLGTFFLRETANVDVIFLATGTGIAPVKAMLESIPHLQKEKRPKSVTVLWGGRKPQDFYMDVADIPGDHTYIPVQSRPEEGWSGTKGYVQDVLLGLAPDLKDAAVYACGSDAMIHGAKKRLTDAGLPSGRFYSDAFVCSGTN